MIGCPKSWSFADDQLVYISAPVQQWVVISYTPLYTEHQHCHRAGPTNSTLEVLWSRNLILGQLAESPIFIFQIFSCQILIDFTTFDWIRKLNKSYSYAISLFFLVQTNFPGNREYKKNLHSITDIVKLIMRSYQ